MITFKSKNIDNETRQWIFKDAEELYDAWMNIEADVPANDDAIWDIEIDGKPGIAEATFERIGTDSIWFEDLLTYLGIDIWG